jgi:hypothetical protein
MRLQNNARASAVTPRKLTGVMEAELCRSAARTRDVVESYRQYNLTVGRWRSRLLTSSASIARIAVHSPEMAGVPLADLAVALRAVARNGLRPERARLDRLSKDLESLVSIRVPGHPRPEDDGFQDRLVFWTVGAVQNTKRSSVLNR